MPAKSLQKKGKKERFEKVGDDDEKNLRLLILIRAFIPFVVAFIGTRAYIDVDRGAGFFLLSLLSSFLF